MVYPSRWLGKVAVLAASLLSMGVGARAQNWSPAVDVSGNNGRNSATPQTAVDASGNIYVVWEDDRDNCPGTTNGCSVILLRKSTDKGATFLDPVIVSPGSSFASAPRIAFDSNGVTYVVWEDAPTSGEQIFINRSIDGGQTFLGPVALSDPGVDSSNPVLAVDAFDNVDVAWEGDTDAPGIPLGIYFSHSLPGGTYSTPVNVASNPYGSFVPQMALGNDGSVNLIWEDDMLGSQNVSFARSGNPNNGGLFDRAIILSSGAGRDFEGQLAVDAFGNINAVWLGVDPLQSADVYFSRWAVQTQGSSFTSPANLSRTGGSTDNPRIASDANGNLYVVWQGTRNNSSRDIFFSAFSASSDGRLNFSFDGKNLSGGLGDATFPWIVVDTHNNVTVAWQLSAPNNNNIFAARTSDGGANFSTQNLSNDALHSSSQVELVTDSAGNTNAVWAGVVGIDPISKAPIAQVFFSQFANPNNQPPVARVAAVQPAHATSPNGATVKLDGSASSDPDGDLLTYSWSDENGNPVGTANQTTDVVAPLGSHNFTLKVTDPGGLSDSASTLVTVSDQAPVASAGADQTVHATGPNGASVTLDGSASSDPDGDTLTYAWTDENNNPIGSTTAITSVTVPLGTHIFTLTVMDPAGLSKTASTIITVTDQAPVARVGADQTVHATGPNGASVMLDGSASSDPDGDALTYSWTDENRNPAGSTAKVQVTVPLGTHTFTLTVMDPAGLSKAASTMVTVTDEAPVARVGADQTVHATGPNGATVKLDGSASSDPEGDTLTYAWTDENGNPVGTTAIVYVPVPMGTHTFTLTVKDPAGLSGSATTHITVTDQRPVARVGADQTVEATGANGATVKLDGSASSDPDGDTLKYAWTDENGNPVGSATAITYVTVPLGIHTFTLTVKDPAGLSDSASTHVTVTDRRPVARVGADQTVEATGPGGAMVGLDGSASSDPDGDALRYAWTDENGIPVGTATAITYVYVPLGMHTFTLTVTDPSGLSSSASTHVIVRDTTAPTLQFSLSPTNLWPANHKLVQITASISASDTVDPNPAVKLVSILSDDLSTTPDDIQAVDGGPVAFGTYVSSFLLRADRDPKNTPRVYTVTYCVKDASGNLTRASAEVSVGPDPTVLTAGKLASPRISRKGKDDGRRRRHNND